MEALTLGRPQDCGAASRGTRRRSTEWQSPERPKLIICSAPGSWPDAGQRPPPQRLPEIGLIRIGQARHIPANDLIGSLDQGGYARYDFRTADRLQALSEVIGERYGGQAAVIAQRFWASSAQTQLSQISPPCRLAAGCRLDARDLESGLVSSHWPTAGAASCRVGTGAASWHLLADPSGLVKQHLRLLTLAPPDRSRDFGGWNVSSSGAGRLGGAPRGCRRKG
jgi:hypothetical protein